MFDWVINTPLICNFVLVLVSWSFVICRIELLDTPVEYENAVRNMETLSKIQEFAAQEFL